MNTKLISICLSMLLLSTSIFTAAALRQIDQKRLQNPASLNDSSFNRLIIILLKIGHYPSMSACIIRNTTLIWEKGYGLYDIEQHKPATEHTIYTVASITKTITSTALMQLYDQGLFGLDDDVDQYLPFNLRNPNFPDEPITIRMLLSHSSSLNPDPDSYHWFNFSQPPPIPWYPDPWLREYLLPNGTFYTPEIWSTTYPPGEHMQYANINYDLVGSLVQLISGEPYDLYCSEHIFQPLSMTHTSFRLSDLPLDDVAIPYLYSKRTYQSLPYYQLLHYPVAGLYTTPEDLSHFLIAHMNHGVFNTTRILSNTSVQLMHTVQPPGNLYYNYRYGLGWMIEEKKLHTEVLIGHTGDIPAVHTRMFLNEKDLIGIICFFNSDRSTHVKMFISLLIQNLLFFKAEHINEPSSIQE
jgi:CubicO group peptidase (beta-lactamase class C family)